MHIILLVSTDIV